MDRRPSPLLRPMQSNNGRTGLGAILSRPVTSSLYHSGCFDTHTTAVGMVEAAIVDDLYYGEW